MNLWTSVFLAWVGVNVVLVALMWRYHGMKERSARQRISRQPAALPGLDAPGPCPHAAAGWHCQPPEPERSRSGAGTEPRPPRRRVVALTSADAAAATWAGPTACTSASHAACRVHELHDEIRVLKLTVAELALDKARLSAAAARRKALS